MAEPLDAGDLAPFAARVALVERACELSVGVLLAIRAEIDAIEAEGGRKEEAVLAARVERLSESLGLLGHRLSLVVAALGMQPVADVRAERRAPAPVQQPTWHVGE